MLKSIVVTAAASTFLLAAAPAVAQNTAPTPRPIAAPAPAPTAGHVKVFDGRNGSATDLRDAPRADETESRPGMGVLKAAPQGPSEARRPTLFVRKSGADATDTSGVVKSGTGTPILTGGTTPPARAQSSNNLKQMGIAR